MIMNNNNVEIYRKSRSPSNQLKDQDDLQVLKFKAFNFDPLNVAGRGRPVVKPKAKLGFNSHHNSRNRVSVNQSPYLKKLNERMQDIQEKSFVKSSKEFDDRPAMDNNGTSVTSGVLKDIEMIE